MLFTSCPDCRTTFRITVEALRQADGDVRCGQCSAVFSAFDTLTDEAPSGMSAERPDAETLQTEAAIATSADPISAEEPGGAAGPDEAEDAGAADDIVVADTDDDIAEEATAGADLESDGDALAEPVETQSSGTDELPEAGTEPIESSEPFVVDSEELEAESSQVASWEFSDQHVDDVLQQNSAPFGSTWTIETAPAADTPKRSYWAAAAALAGALLAVQVSHHFREDVSGLPVIGSVIRATYRWIGSPLPATWMPDAFEIVNWSTASESPSGDVDRLRFTASIRNVSDATRPLPLVHLTLTDRWEQAIGSRYFEPEEYLAEDDSNISALASGGVADIRLDLVDPGPRAYGFEVDVCVEISAQAVRCSADDVFQ